jgi:hypothetical protein
MMGTGEEEEDDGGDQIQHNLMINPEEDTFSQFNEENDGVEEVMPVGMIEADDPKLMMDPDANSFFNNTAAQILNPQYDNSS